MIGKQYKMLGNIYLYNRNARGKVIVTYLHTVHNVEEDTYTINKQTGQLTGKWTVQPSKTIEKGKAKRTVEQQFELELNSIIKKLRDKGYKLLTKDLELTNDDFLNEDLISSKLGIDKTTADGYKKPMLAVDSKKLSTSQLSRAWWTSLKLDGYRTLVHLETTEDGTDYLVFKTRGGGTYKGVAETLKQDPLLIDIIRTYNCEIDGEFYIHGLPLNEHTKICNKEEYDPELHDKMNFYIFDLADNERTCNDRVKILHSLADDYENDETINPRIKFVRHKYVMSPEELPVLLDEAVANGYEGLMAREVMAKYQWGKRNKSLVKFKPFLDAEFEIKGIVQGNRYIHDMVFELYTEDKQNTFKAVPLGDFNIRKEYTENEKDYVGKMATIKFQRIHEETGIPQITTFISIREQGT